MAEVGGSEDSEDMQVGVLCFICKNYSLGVSGSVIGKKMAALAFWFQLKGLRDVKKSFLVHRALRGYRKGLHKQDCRRSVSFAVLSTIISSLRKVCSDHFEQVLFRAAFILAFFGAFRIGELVSPSKKVVGGLKLDDVPCSEQSVLICITHSKNDQEGKGVRVELLRGQDPQLCPVTALRQFLDIRPIGGGIVHPQGWTVPLQISVHAGYEEVLNSRWSPSGGIRRAFVPHRCGHEASRWGLPETVIKRIGRWESCRYQLYVRPHLM